MAREDNSGERLLKNIDIRLEELGMKRNELAAKIGISRQTMFRWFTKGSWISTAYVEKIAEALGVTPEWLRGLHITNADVLDNLVVVANVSAGAPEVNFEDGMLLKDALHLDKTCFALKVVGDSMTGEYVDQCIPNGSYVILSRADTSLAACLGRVVYASVDAGKYSLKELRQYGDRYVLCPWNKRYRPIDVTENTLILGVVIGWFCKA